MANNIENDMTDWTTIETTVTYWQHVSSGKYLKVEQSYSCNKLFDVCHETADINEATPLDGLGLNLRIAHDEWQPVQYRVDTKVRMTPITAEA